MTGQAPEAPSTPEAASPIVPVFVVGCPRSGTTLVGELVAAHNDVLNAEESCFVYLLRNWEAMLNPPVAPLTIRFLASARQLIHDFIIAETRAAAKRYFLDHTPWHALCLEQVWSIFPEARVVNVVRHPADVIASLGHSYSAGFRWAGASVEARAILWKEFAEVVGSKTEELRLLTIRYEELCETPSDVGRQLYRWLGLEWNDANLDVFAHSHAPNPGREFALATGRWPSLAFRSLPQREVSAAMSRMLERIGADRAAARFGYEVSASAL